MGFIINMADFKARTRALERVRKDFERSSKTKTRASRREERIVGRELREPDRHPHAAIHAGSAVNYRSQSEEAARRASQIAVIQGRLEQAVDHVRTARSIARVAESLDDLLAETPAAEVTDSLRLMEKRVEEINAFGHLIGHSVDQTAGSAGRSAEVNALIQRVAEENNLELQEELFNQGGPLSFSYAGRTDPISQQQQTAPPRRLTSPPVQLGESSVSEWSDPLKARPVPKGQPADSGAQPDPNQALFERLRKLKK